MMMWPLWVADLAAFQIQRYDVDPQMGCADLTQVVRRWVPNREEFVLYHFGLAKIVPAGSSQSVAEYGMRGGDVLFLVPRTWPIGICRWLAEDVLDAALTTPPRSTPKSRLDGS